MKTWRWLLMLLVVSLPLAACGQEDDEAVVYVPRVERDVDADLMAFIVMDLYWQSYLYHQIAYVDVPVYAPIEVYTYRSGATRPMPTYSKTYNIQQTSIVYQKTSGPGAAPPPANVPKPSAKNPPARPASGATNVKGPPASGGQKPAQPGPAKPANPQPKPANPAPPPRPQPPAPAPKPAPPPPKTGK